jgi:hypothetical protein
VNVYLPSNQLQSVPLWDFSSVTGSLTLSLSSNQLPALQVDGLFIHLAATTQYQNGIAYAGLSGGANAAPTSASAAARTTLTTTLYWTLATN